MPEFVGVGDLEEKREKYFYFAWEKKEKKTQQKSVNHIVEFFQQFYVAVGLIIAW